jgi:hypothetical protein
MASIRKPSDDLKVLPGKNESMSEADEEELATKAEGEREMTLLTPTPPNLTGREAWAQALLSRRRLRINERMRRISSSRVWRMEERQHGAVRSR